MGYSNHIKHHSEESALLNRAVDIILICAVLIVTCFAYLGDLTLIYELIMCIVVIAYFMIADICGLYRTYKYTSLRQTFMTITTIWCICIGITLGLGFFLKISESYSRAVLGIWYFLVPPALILWRLAAIRIPRLLRPSDSYQDKSIIIGATRSGMLLAKQIKENDYLNEKLIGFYDDRTLDRIGHELPVPMRGNIDDALLLAKNRGVKNIYIALPMEASMRIKQILNEFADSNANVHIVPDFFIFDLMQSRLRNVGNMVTLSVYDTPFIGFSNILKRVEDIVLASVIITLISPILAVVAIGVKLSSPGPVIFKQDRYGLDGKPIKVWKFRSMRAMDNGEKVKQATKDDPRITPFGSFIRRTSLDELPQFFNVLTGRMSIVGPRPHAVAHNEEYRGLIDKYMLRHNVKPGITGWAQINGFRGETDTLYKMEKRVEYDLTYIQNWSLWLDIKIVFLTIFKGFVGKTAY
ncbi:undecaprenyl-phosphate glucose phosphotransferase [Vibrio sp. JC009]|uniref:undecaprenyl-phosphate glucose phosphotransferase n=1 Tax=Vibrio sp. JC009 TaxID=2912314 RepID=UPI0023B1F5C4|nr:undecaprenyl-phosphate glucose phosphotransferase [Vibrio sp. JC009]WED20648.1 undecaprenyl-phosphate glucose phosphotransferase [Vibrio sp. JC009]